MKTICFTLVLMACLTSGVRACVVNGGFDDDLYQVFNQFFYSTSDSNRLGSDIELMNSGLLIPNGDDVLWGQAGDTFRVDATYREATYVQALGYRDAGGDHLLIDRDAIPNHQYATHGITFGPTQPFRWTDHIQYPNGDRRRWSSDPGENPLGGKDHFLAFAITDNLLLSVFNTQFGTDYNAVADRVWMIAFEDLNLGDADYTDLVAVVAKPKELNVTAAPVPGAIWLFGSVLGGLAGGRFVFARLRTARTGALEGIGDDGTPSMGNSSDGGAI